ncbi:iron-containing redox enzyme family protein [Rhodococcus coprophilus]|uniref:Iron-containing redox enzyme family protein n=1 Tax=Rhodococcus coprophilus TaxID=38310 RepID=A0A2X4TNQ0_9NOCA|nr:iron-containing redox enzyme family protein [Rhodococcus coprophilus]SQI28801.1 Uncharacterised protein [Rhodococcus coprophilus]
MPRSYELPPHVLPTPRGSVSEAVIAALSTDPSDRVLLPTVSGTDPLGEDAQSALYTCYELHYQGFSTVDDAWEWQPDLIRMRTQLERLFLGALRDLVPSGDDALGEMDSMSETPETGTGPSWHLRDHGTWPQMQEYFAHRSLYHLKEGDPQAWVIPRLTGQAKAAFTAVEFDEYGGGRGDRMHSEMFAALLSAAGLNPAYLAYLDEVPAETMATVNLMSLFGLHRALRGAAVGHFAAAEITSSPGCHRLVEALHRLRAPEPCVRFYEEHVEADAVHELVLRTDVVEDLLDREPALAADVVFGMRAFDYVEELFADRLMDAWSAGRSSMVTGGSIVSSESGYPRM